MEFGRNRENSVEFQENSVELSGIQYGASYEFSGNSWGISEQRRVFGEIWGLGWFRAIWGLKRLLRKSFVAALPAEARFFSDAMSFEPCETFQATLIM